jgi:hypothetical protein
MEALGGARRGSTPPARPNSRQIVSPGRAWEIGPTGSPGVGKRIFLGPFRGIANFHKLHINIFAKESSRSDWGSNPRPTATPPSTKYQRSTLWTDRHS